MTGCARCAEMAALAARPTNAVRVPCAHCGVPGWLANPTPGFPYAGCIGCYWALWPERNGRAMGATPDTEGPRGNRSTASAPVSRRADR